MKSIRFALFFIFLILSTINAQDKIRDIIKPINLTAGQPDSLLISDLFYSDDYNPIFIKNSNVDVTYKSSAGMIYLTTDKNFSGLTTVEMKQNGILYSIPIRSSIKQKYKFSYKPGKKYTVLTLFGSFNGWNRNNLIMTDINNDGVYEIEIPLEPGRYEYKFFGDGEEIVDPNNPDKKPNGFGDFNSLFNVEESDNGKIFLHVDKGKKSESEICYSFIYENEKDGSKINPDNILALIDNQKLSSDKIKIDKSRIRIALSEKEIETNSLLRIAVTKNGFASNLQSVCLNDKSDRFKWNDAIIYSLMIDRFSDGDKSINKPIVQDSLFEKANYMGGDFKGIIDKLNEGYFDSLGVNTIWLSPVYDNPDRAYREAPAPHRWFSGYHGYWPINSNDVEDQFGTLEQLKTLIETAHKRGIKILLDIVANHVHELHPIFKEKPEWFGELKLPDGRMNLRLWDEFRLTTWFEPYLPKFNFVNSTEAVNFMAENALWWLKTTGADGFRQDAVKHIPNHFWRSLTRKLKSEIEIPTGKTVYQIGETFGSYELINSYVNNGQLNAQFNFNLYDTALPTFLDPKSNFKALDSEIKKSFLFYGENNLMGNVMDSHDKNRFMSFADSDLDLSQWSAAEEGWNNPPKVDDPKNYNKAKLYLAYLNAIPGLPVIYYGSEFGMTGASDPDNRRMMRFENELSIYEKEMLQDVRKILNLRKKHSSLNRGDFQTLQADENIYAFIRSDFNERILVVLNKSTGQKTIEIKIPDFYNVTKAKNLISEENYSVTNNNISVTIEGIGYRFIKLD